MEKHYIDLQCCRIQAEKVMDTDQKNDKLAGKQDTSFAFTKTTSLQKAILINPYS